ncbi:TetR/AcrR family transcriptional regulator [Nonomuraea sp. NPDC050404]|uniref:TetR/AcrR family transcriptional regulator n=1 Tax=Nonomuraea sp. NPDC050404 TaxID=3155783 RepID=UPI0033E24C41
MRSESGPDGQKRSFIEEARRTQIIESAIETLTEMGYAGASLARIAERAGTSKGVILYHFGDKNELVERIVEQIYLDIAQYVVTRTEKESTAAGSLRANIRAVAAYMRGRRAQLLALREIRNNFRTPDGKPRYGVDFNEPIYQAREELFRRGQQEGEFRSFNPRVMSVAVQSAIDGMFAYWVANPDHDLEAHADELADLFEHAARTGHPGETAER